MTTRQDVLERLGKAAPEFKDTGVDQLWVFGSVARGEEREGSDVDILVDFSTPVTIFEFVRLRRRLEVVLGRSVDLTTRDALRPQLRASILREAVRAAWGSAACDSRTSATCGTC